MKQFFILILAVGLAAAACGSESSPTKKDENNSNAANTSSSTPEMGGTLLLTDTGKFETISCNQRDVELDSESTANTYTFTGECKTLIVDGVSNKVYVEKVGSIDVKGISNKVFYKSGLDGEKPKIKKEGTSTIVEQEKEKDEGDKKDK
ncbi:MAG: DUF3060 domain-containing protein [Pyrinomonadaceae bacterium]